MNWRVANSLLVLRDQVDALWPTRAKGSDGTIGDRAHANRESDHNPDADGVVKAMDITHDPRSGCDSYALAEALRQSKDPRIKYIISNNRICSSEVSPWLWRPYHGIDGHEHHMHLSVKKQATYYDSRKPWIIDESAMPGPVPTSPPATVLKRGDTGPEVKDLQGKLNKIGIQLQIDGLYGPGTERGVKRFQESRGLLIDGVFGPQTRKALDNEPQS